MAAGGGDPAAVAGYDKAFVKIILSGPLGHELLKPADEINSGMLSRMCGAGDRPTVNIHPVVINVIHSILKEHGAGYEVIWRQQQGEPDKPELKMTKMRITAALIKKMLLELHGAVLDPTGNLLPAMQEAATLLHGRPIQDPLQQKMVFSAFIEMAGMYLTALSSCHASPAIRQLCLDMFQVQSMLPPYKGINKNDRLMWSNISFAPSLPEDSSEQAELCQGFFLPRQSRQRHLRFPISSFHKCGRSRMVINHGRFLRHLRRVMRLKWPSKSYLIWVEIFV